MKQTILYLVASIFLLASCQQEEQVAEETATGYLSIEGIALQADIQTVSSRAVDADLYVEILKDGETYSLYNPGTVPDKIELPVGTYQLRAYNEASLMKNPYEGLGYAVYSSEAQSFEVKAGEVTLRDLEVPMTNFGVTLQLPEEFATYFGENYTFTVKSNDREVKLKDGETAYFPYSENVTFSYSLKAVNADGEESEQEGGTRTEVARGTVYTITYTMATPSLSVAQ